MPIILRESDVQQVLDMPGAISAVEEATRGLATGRSRNVPRERIRLPKGWLHVLPGADQAQGVLGVKTYTSFREGTRFLVTLYGATDGKLLALIEADLLGMMRTGAVSAVAAQYMARPSADRVAIFGTGWQARGQVLGLAASRALAGVRVYGRDEDRRRRFAERLSEETGVEVAPSSSPQEALDGADIVVTATTAREPVVAGELVSPGTHINAVGSNSLIRREIDDGLIKRASRIVVDSRAQARQESGDLLGAVERGWLEWDLIPELAEVVSGRVPGRESEEEITIFESHGLGVHDVAVAAHVLRRAQQAGLGEEVRLFDEMAGGRDA